MIKQKKNKLFSALLIVLTILIAVSSAVSAAAYNTIKKDYYPAHPDEKENEKYFYVDLFDYNREDPDQISSAIKKEWPDAKRSSYFSFIGGGSNSEDFSMISCWTGTNGGIIKGLATESKGSGSINYAKGITGIDLFNSDSSYYDVYNNVSFPFKYENGKYVFDSEKNSATFNSETGIVGLGKANGGFWPFGVNKYHFGMHMKVDFYIPAGKMLDNQDIIFNFSGDDDVWVYIDNELVLDVGGIHEAYAGNINFTDATVTEPKAFGTYPKMNKPSASTTESNDFIASLEENSVHTLEIFYLERGASKSNCRIEFNLPEYEPLIIKKEVSGLNEDVNNDTEFTFNIKTAATEEDKETSADYTGEYDLYEGSSFIARRNTDENGCFTLKDGQEARFDKLLVETYFEVTEVSASESSFSSYFDAAEWIKQNDLIAIENNTIKGVLLPDTESERSYSVTCENVRRVTDISFNKIDSFTSQAIPETEFLLSGISDLEESINIYAYSDTEGVVTFTGVPQGIYNLTETQSNASYIPNAAVLSVEVTCDEDGYFEMLIRKDNEMIYSGTASEPIFNIKNDPKTISITAKKIWEDNNNSNNTRPDSITVNLLADGQKILSQIISSAENWEYTFEDLKTHNENGAVIKYTLSEEEVKNYTASYNGYEIKNTYKPPIIPNIPDTSDNITVILFIVLALGASAALVTFVILRKRSVSNQNK